VVSVGLSTRDRSVRYRGISLVEVMASLLLLGTTITAVLVAQARSLRTISLANERMVAAELARELITGWQLDGTDVLVAASGQFPGRENWTWSRESTLREVQDQVRMREVTVRTEHARADGSVEPFSYDFVWLVNENANGQ